MILNFLKKGYLNSKGLGTVWLLNLKRLYNIFKNYNADYHFIDIGCGNGISVIYSYKSLIF